MGAGFKASPQGEDWIATKFKATQAQIDAMRTAANIRNSKITGGSGLTIEDPSGQSIQLLVGPDGVSRQLFSPPTADQVGDWVASIGFDPDGAYGGGELFFNSIGSPISSFLDQPAQTAFMSLGSGDGISSPANVSMSTSFIELQLIDPFSGNPAKIALGSIGTSSRIEEDATSWRLLVGDASLIFPQATSEVRVRDINNTVYTVIRASAFTVTSTREAKQDITEIDSAAEIVANAKAYQWRYRPEHADPDRVHFGPMAEDLPDELVDHGDPDVPGVNTADLIGVLWAAVGEQQATIAALTKRVEALEAQRATG